MKAQNERAKLLRASKLPYEAAEVHRILYEDHNAVLFAVLRGSVVESRYYGFPDGSTLRHSSYTPHHEPLEPENESPAALRRRLGSRFSAANAR